MKKIILASKSPRRRELLQNIGIDFDIVLPETDESTVSEDIEARLYVQELALLKACDSAKKVGKSILSDRIIISADTIVVLDGKILGKPIDEADAVRMLSEFSGRTHQAMTGISVFRVNDGFSVCDTVVTDVTFKELSLETVELYVKSGESLDKAGGYGIQGLGNILCEKIDGDYFNVVGLPLSRLCDILKSEFDYDILKLRSK